MAPEYAPGGMSRTLPIDPHLPAIVEHTAAGNLVLAAAPGAGKTTRVPRALLESGLVEEGEVLVLEPRRLAARLAAERIAHERGEEVGGRVGSHIRFERRVSNQTRLTFLTEGLLLRRLRDDPELRGVRVVVLDEVHERNLATDLSLALLRRLRARRRERLSIVTMSATLDAEVFAAHLDAPIVRVEGRVFPVEIEHRAPGELPLERAVRAAVQETVNTIRDGHVLVFLPGAREIRTSEEACRELAAREGLRVHVLHGERSRSEQDAAVAPSRERKLILATNVAETSITIDDVSIVIDSGLARIASHDPWTGFPKLSLAPISRASATQRAGRAGRTREGLCVRLYSKADHDRRPAYTAPEIVRLDLADALLDIASAGASPEQLPWLEAPPVAALDAARALLTRLGAIDDEGTLTSLGQRMSRLPAHPRLARLAIAAHDLGIPELGATAAALLGERPGGRDRHAVARSGDCDLAEEIEALSDTSRGRSEIDAAARDRIAKSKAAMLRAMGRGDGARRDHDTGATRRGSHDERALDVDTRERKLREALLLAFPDRVAKLRAGTGTKRVCVFASGGSAELSSGSVVREATLAVAVAVDTRKEGTHLVTEVRSAAAIEAEWLLDHFPDRVVDEEVLAFDATRGRVTGRSTMRYEGLELEATQLRTLPARASELLFDAAVAAGLDRFVEAEVRHELVARVRFVVQHRPALAEAVADEALLVGLREGLGDGLFREALREACRGKTSFTELGRVNLLDLVRERLGELAWELDRLAPSQVSLPGGRRTKVTYELDAAPWIASRLQDFFGMRQGPTLLDGKVPIVLHLRAPNNRDVQVTTDLANFWRTHYPEQRRMLMRRYPRHAWPEDPLTATPPAPGPRR